MAQKRMLSRSIMYDDDFTDLPAQTRMLYVYLVLEADDDGIVSSIKAAMVLSGAKQKDLKKLEEKRYILKFSDGSCVIRHWLLMNTIQPSRKAVSKNVEQFLQLKILDDKTYEICRQNDDKLSHSLNQNQESLNQYQERKEELDDIERKTVNFTTENATENEWINFMVNPEFKKVHAYFTDKIGNISQPEHYNLLNSLLNEIGLNTLMVCIDFMVNQSKGKTVPYLEKIVHTHPELLEVN